MSDQDQKSSFQLELEERLLAARLRQMDGISEAIDSRSRFLIDTSSNEILAYPIMRRARAKQNGVLDLNGTHWRYNLGDSLGSEISREDKDTRSVFGSRTCVPYSFTQRDIRRLGSLWIFVQETSGMEYQQRVLVPILQQDLTEYEKTKRELKSSRSLASIGR